ncbi:MAG: hypothetical protein E7324_04490 [Clostridiales bacterium]|nr:hypothetical protein [Clostridiales bacterium]
MKRMGKRVIRYFITVISIALIIGLVIAILPHLKLLTDQLLSGDKYKRTTLMLEEKMEQTGELTAIRYEQTGVMNANVDAALLGTVGSITAPYRYEAVYGFSLADVELIAGEDGITAVLPPVRILYDKFQLTDDAQIQDFWNLVTEKRYQQVLDRQAAECRMKYETPAYAKEAWVAACEELQGMFTKWTGEELPVTFLQADQAPSPTDQP